MSPKKRTSKKERSAQSDKTIQYAAIAAIVVVVVLLVWSVVRGNAPAEEAQAEIPATEETIVEVIPQTEAPQPTAAAPTDTSAQSEHQAI
jgi:hypothetical protein